MLLANDLGAVSRNSPPRASVSYPRRPSGREPDWSGHDLQSHGGDGKVFATPLEECILIRTGERGAGRSEGTSFYYMASQIAWLPLSNVNPLPTHISRGKATGMVELLFQVQFR